MSDDVLLKLEPEKLEVNPGEKVEAQISVQNSGRLVDVFTLDVNGLDEAWYDLSTTSVSLFPGDSAASKLIISVPKDTSVCAGTRPFDVKVSSRKSASEVTSSPGSLDVLPFYSFSADIQPQKVTGPSGSYTITLSNSGNTDITFSLESRDDEALCTYTFDPAEPTVRPGQETQVVMTVVPGQRPLKGPPAFHSFTVKVTPGVGDLQPAELFGQLEVPPRLPAWAVKLAMTAGVLLIGAIVAGIALLVIYKPWATSWDVDTDVGIVKQSAQSGVAFVHPVELKPVPADDVTQAAINVTWKGSSGNPAGAVLNVVLQHPNGSCQDADERSDGQPLVFDLNVEEQEWLDGCPQMKGQESKLIANKWAIYLKNETNEQLSSVRLQLRYQ